MTTSASSTGEYKKLLLDMLQRREAWELVDVVNKLTDPSALADMAGYASDPTHVQKRQLLETVDVAERLQSADQLDRRSSGRVSSRSTARSPETSATGMEKQQKEFLLRQQLAAYSQGAR